MNAHMLLFTLQAEETLRPATWPAHFGPDCPYRGWDEVDWLIHAPAASASGGSPTPSEDKAKASSGWNRTPLERRGGVLLV